MEKWYREAGGRFVDDDPQNLEPATKMSASENCSPGTTTTMTTFIEVRGPGQKAYPQFTFHPSILESPMTGIMSQVLVISFVDVKYFDPIRLHEPWPVDGELRLICTQNEKSSAGHDVTVIFMELVCTRTCLMGPDDVGSQLLPHVHSKVVQSSRIVIATQGSLETKTFLANSKSNQVMNDMLQCEWTNKFRLQLHNSMRPYSEFVTIPTPSPGGTPNTTTLDWTKHWLDAQTLRKTLGFEVLTDPDFPVSAQKFAVQQYRELMDRLMSQNIYRNEEMNFLHETVANFIQNSTIYFHYQFEDMAKRIS